MPPIVSAEQEQPLSNPEKPPGSLRPLLDHRLVIVTGKGGTGKTSVAAALSLAGARQGLRVALVETGRDEHAPRLFEPGAAPVGYAGRELSPGLLALRIDPYAALSEYLQLELRVPSLVTRVLQNRGFRQLLDAAPGWRELITLGKVWHLREQRRIPTTDRPDDGGDGDPAFDLIVVDAPATGHGLVFLDVPRVVASAVRTGPLQRHARQVEAMVKDPRQTLLLPVTLAEELPARETAELVESLQTKLGVCVDRVVVNALLAAPFPVGLGDLPERLSTLEALPAGVPGLPSAPALASCARHLRERFELGQEYLARVQEWTGLPTVTLPYLTGGVHGMDDLDRLGRALQAVPSGAEDGARSPLGGARS